MKIICLLGSPRNDGNSTTIAHKFIETAASLGAEVRIFMLNSLVYRGCQGCCECKTKRDQCVLQDDLTGVLEVLKEANVVVLAAPVYFGDVPGQVKKFIDRTYAYMLPNYVNNPKCSRLAPGKKLVLIITQGAPDESLFADVPNRYDGILRRVLNLAEVYLIRACGVGAGGIPKGVPEKFLQEAEKIARAIVT
jgi:multimeric flavodoxin WrbA